MELVAFRPDEAQQLIDWIDSPELNLLWGGPCYAYPLTQEQIFEHCQKPEVFAFLCRHEGENVGFIELFHLGNNAYRICRVFIAPDYRGRGMAQSMVTQLIAVAKQQFAARELSLGVFAHNHSALACYQALGFSRYASEPFISSVSDEPWLLYRMKLDVSECQEVMQ